MAEYIYNQVAKDGYRWNILQRCLNEVGIEPINCFDTQIDGILKTILSFSRELTIAEKTNLDTLMANNPTLPPTTGGTIFKIDDIWEKLANFRSTTGIQWKLYFSQSVANGPIDTIELHAGQTLTTPQKNQTRNAFAALIRES